MLSYILWNGLVHCFFVFHQSYVLLLYHTMPNDSRPVLGLPPKIEYLTPLLPTLRTLLADIGRLAESGAKYDDAPEMVDIILPMVCRSVCETFYATYSAMFLTKRAFHECAFQVIIRVWDLLFVFFAARNKKSSLKSSRKYFSCFLTTCSTVSSFVDCPALVFCSYLRPWHEQGPDSGHTVTSTGEIEHAQGDYQGGFPTIVSHNTLTNVLRDILQLIYNNLAVEKADWMRRIAGRWPHIGSIRNPAIVRSMQTWFSLSLVYTLPILIREDVDLLPNCFLPILEKCLKKIHQTRALEEQVGFDWSVCHVTESHLHAVKETTSTALNTFTKMLVQFCESNNMFTFHPKHLSLHKTLHELLWDWNFQTHSAVNLGVRAPYWCKVPSFIGRNGICNVCIVKGSL